MFYCVLTDRNFIIQIFTPNCCDFLGLNSNVINYVNIILGPVENNKINTEQKIKDLI